MYTHWHAGHGLQNQGFAEQKPSTERRAASHGPYDRDNPSSRTWRHAPTTIIALGRMGWQYAIARPDRRRPETHGHTTLCVPHDGPTRKQEHRRQNLKNATENILDDRRDGLIGTNELTGTAGLRYTRQQPQWFAATVNVIHVAASQTISQLPV